MCDGLYVVKKTLEVEIQQMFARLAQILNRSIGLYSVVCVSTFLNSWKNDLNYKSNIHIVQIETDRLTDANIYKTSSEEIQTVQNGEQLVEFSCNYNSVLFDKKRTILNEMSFYIT